MYWVNTLDLIGQQEQQNQNILESLREALEGRGGHRIKLFLESQENESAMSELEAKMRVKESSLVGWEAMTGTAQQQLEKEEANEISKAILEDILE